MEEMEFEFGLGMACQNVDEAVQLEENERIGLGDPLCDPIGYNNPIIKKVESERVEVYFKPKAKYVDALEKCDKITRGLEGTVHMMRVKKLTVLGFINIFTGELNLPAFVEEVGILDAKEIKDFIGDRVIKEELLDAINNPQNRNDIFSSKKYLYNCMNDNFDQPEVFDYLIKRDGRVMVSFNIADLAKNEYTKKNYYNYIGFILGTFAESIDEVVFVKYSDFMDNEVLRYEKLKFEVPADLNSLTIFNVRVPNKKVLDKCMSYLDADEAFDYDSNIVRRDIKIKLIDKAKKYHIKASIRIREDLKKIISDLFNAANVIDEAVRKGHLKYDYCTRNDDIEEDIENDIFTKFEILLSEFNLDKLIAQNLCYFDYIRESNREYELAEHLSGISNKNIYDVLLKHKKYERFEYESTEEDEDFVSYVSCGLYKAFNKVMTNKVEGDNWEFEADASYIDPDDIKKLINAVCKNISFKNNVALLSIEEV